MSDLVYFSDSNVVITSNTARISGVDYNLAELMQARVITKLTAKYFRTLALAIPLSMLALMLIILVSTGVLTNNLLNNVMPEVPGSFGFLFISLLMLFFSGFLILSLLWAPDVSQYDVELKTADGWVRVFTSSDKEYARTLVSSVEIAIHKKTE